ncbi:hypothetical protein VNO77_41885 [Canavalia gladiata]|uniref:Uncharacterized protein n=1 Tax=Canavalia gladiata TaxID=3824 RepID=A0AAN9PSW2_CANGL
MLFLLPGPFLKTIPPMQETFMPSKSRLSAKFVPTWIQEGNCEILVSGEKDFYINFSLLGVVAVIGVLSPAQSRLYKLSYVAKISSGFKGRLRHAGGTRGRALSSRTPGRGLLPVIDVLPKERTIMIGAFWKGMKLYHVHFTIQLSLVSCLDLILGHTGTDLVRQILWAMIWPEGSSHALS